MSFLNSRYARVLTLVLLLQAFAYYTVAFRSERTPQIAPLASFPWSVGGWQTLHDAPLEKEVLDLLKADDTLNREYANPATEERASLFIAYFKTQRYGQSPHSPKNCLPGSGWEQVETGTIPIAIPGRAEPIVSNKYVVAFGDERSVVLYWYQSHNRVIASEYKAKFWLVADAIRYHRSDTALVRIIVPVHGGDIAAATRTGVSFVQAIFGSISNRLPA